MKIVILTLGCKVNQYESDCLAERFKEMGHETSDQLEKADLYVINTCAVTNESEKKSRQLIAKIKSVSENAKIFVMGCASQHDPKQFLKNQNVTYITGTKNKTHLASKILESGIDVLVHDEIYDEEKITTSSNTRAYLKIQDGCNNFCSYCLIPYLRGRSRSRDLNKIINQAKILAQNGTKEIVLTGINITDYKIDGKLALGKLLVELDKLNVQIRLGSLEESLLSEDFVKLIAGCKNLCPHFHLSLQSGSDKVLRDMNRHYTSRQFLKAVKLLRKYFKNPCITTDVIVGYPTETAKHFKHTCNFVKKVKFAYLHVFQYSLRAGTPASKLEQVPSFEKKERAKKLEEINKKLHFDYLKHNLKKVKDVLVEENKNGYFFGHTNNYIKCYIKKDVKPNQFVKVELKSIYLDGVLGEVVK